MANEVHLQILRRGIEAWNRWRIENPNVQPDLKQARLINTPNLIKMNLRKTDLSGASLVGVALIGADLRNADLGDADLCDAVLREADLSGAHFRRTYLGGADLSRATLVETDFYEANLSGANLCGANFDKAFVGATKFGDNDLRQAIGLETVQHCGPSTIGIDTLYRSQGKIPEEFLRGCGVPEDFITYLPSLIGTMQPIQYQSCFISYSSQDDEFARRLHEKMRGEKLRVWFAPEDMQGGKKLIEQIDRAIQVNDRLLLVLSEHSMNSEWVKTELRKARQAELREQRQKLFPIRLVSIDRIRAWSCFDADTGKDLAVELREYHIPDFSNWKNHDAFESAFADLLRDLRAGLTP